MTTQNPHSTNAKSAKTIPTPVIVLCAGHGGSDFGAVNTSYQNKTHTESSIACEMRNIVAHILKNDYGMGVKTDGTGKENLPLKQALSLIQGSHLAIDFHTNASANKTATGIECLTLPKNKAIAQTLCQAVAQVTDWRLRGELGFKSDNAGQHSRLAFARSGGLVFEPFFISNDDDLALWYGKKWLICRAVAQAIAEWFGVAKRFDTEQPNNDGTTGEQLTNADLVDSVPSDDGSNDNSRNSGGDSNDSSNDTGGASNASD